MNRIIFVLLIVISIYCRKPGPEQSLPDSVGGNMYVNSSNGVKMRKEPSLTAPVISIIPKDALIIVAAAQPQKIQIDKKDGYWIRGSYRDLKGWIFSGFLTLQPRISTLKQNPIGGYLNGDTDFILYEEPKIESKVLAKAVDNVQIIEISEAISKVNDLPVRWVKVTSDRMSSGKLTGWVYTAQLLTPVESNNALDPRLSAALNENLGGTSYRVETIKKFENFMVLTINKSDGMSCNGYGESTCITIVLKDSKIIYSDASSGSMGYLEKISQGFAFFFIQMGEGEPCGGFFEKKTTVLNLKNLEKWQIEKYINTQCDKCIRKGTEQTCMNDQFTSTTSMKYLSNKNIEIDKGQVPVAVMDAY